MSRLYGHDGTIHRTEYVNVETYNGKVVAVWFRCQALPFDQSETGINRANEMIKMYEDYKVNLLAVEVEP